MCVSADERAHAHAHAHARTEARVRKQDPVLRKQDAVLVHTRALIWMGGWGDRKEVWMGG